MIKDKTVTMSRELAQEAFDELTDWNSPTANKLYAILAAPVVEPQCSEVNPQCSELLRTQAPVVESQPYGYWICPKGNPKLGSFHHEVLDTTEQYCEVTPLYTSPPAPVAATHTMQSVMSAICAINSFPMMTSNQCHALAQSLNACLDKVKEMNR